jgi:hypothetical protein
MVTVTVVTIRDGLAMVTRRSSIRLAQGANNPCPSTANHGAFVLSAADAPH